MVGSKSTILVANEETKQLETIEIWGGKEHEMIGKKLKMNKGVEVMFFFVCLFVFLEERIQFRINLKKIVSKK